MVDLGYNYRITDFQCALGLSQLGKLEAFLKKRREIAQAYDEAFKNNRYVSPLAGYTYNRHAYHLYIVKISFDQLAIERKDLFKKLRGKGIGVNVHYIPIHLHPFYKKRFNTKYGLCPLSESIYKQILSLPIHPLLNAKELTYIIDTIEKEVKA
jgi:perosamine synthetase